MCVGDNTSHYILSRLNMIETKGFLFLLQFLLDIQIHHIFENDSVYFTTAHNTNRSMGIFGNFVKNSIFEEKKFSEISIIWIGQRDDDDKSWELQLWECV